MIKRTFFAQYTCCNYHKDDEQNADCGKDDATKGDNWESTLEIHDTEDIFLLNTLVAIITKMMNRMPIAAKMKRPKGTIGNRH